MDAVAAAGAADNGQLIELTIASPFHRVYFLPDSRLNEVQVGVVILAGEVDFDGPEGLSHYLEHLMFWHADKVDDQALHARGGNAWVNGIITNYYNSGSESDLDDLFEFARRLFTQPALDNRFMLDERKVVSREYDLRVSESPEWRVFTELRRDLYNHHPVARSVIGTPKSIMSLTIDDAREFHSQYYQPANAVLLVTGNVAKDVVLKKIQNTFSDLPAGVLHEQQWRNAFVPGSLRQTEIHADRQVNHDRLGITSLTRWSGSGDRTQDVYTAQLLQNILQSALPGSLAKPLRIDNFIVRQYELNIFKLLAEQVEMQFWASPDAGVTTERAAAEVEAALLSLAEAGVPVKTLERTRKRWLQTEKRLSKNAGSTLFRAYQHLSLGIAPNNVDDHLQRIARISEEDVNTLLRALAKPDRRVTGYITGTGE